MSERKRLPDRRANTTFQFQCAGLKYACSYSRFADDCRVAELFLSNTKSTSQSDSNARDAAVAASLALQYGCALATLRGAVLRNADGSASTPLGTAIDIITELEAES